MLELKDIYCSINTDTGEKKEILSGINLKFEPGKLYGITGPNGGGKTSLAKVIMGIFKQTSGTIELDGEDITELGVSDRANKGISYAFQHPPRFKGLTIKDVLQIASSNEAQEKNVRMVMRQVGLCPEDYFDRDLGTGLSGGEIKRIEMAQVLLRNTRVSIFDEPEAGVDLWTVQKLINLLLLGYKNNPEKIALIISHNENILPICDEIIVVSNGEVENVGTAKQIWHSISDDIKCCTRNRQCQGDFIDEIE